MAATSPTGQQFSARVGGGYTLSYTLTRTAAPTDWAPWGPSATPIVYTDAFGNDAYTGVAGMPAIYPTAPKLNDGVRNDITIALSDIRVTDPSGQMVSGYVLSIADAETLNDTERYTFTTNGSPWQVQASIGQHPVCENGLTGVGTTQLSCVGAVSNTTDVGDLVAATTDGPTRLSVTSSILHGREGFTFAINTATVSATAALTSRANPGDQFTTGVRSSAGTTVVSATTGANLEATGMVTVPAGSPLTLFDEAAGTTAPGSYTASWTCTNAIPGSSTVLPVGGEATSFTPKPADTISCAATHIPVQVSGVSVTPQPAVVMLPSGATAQVTATVQPPNAAQRGVTWATSNASVATVDANGKITGHRPGTATITVTTVDGGKTATVFVTVAPSALALTGAGTVPGSYARGHRVQIIGDVTSNYPLTNVTATITDTRTGDAIWTQTINPGARSFDLAIWDTGYTFADLPAGNYRYTVVATDGSSTTRTLQSAAFAVTPPTTLSFAAGVVFPTTAEVARAIKPGTRIRIEGDVFSNYPLTQVTATIATSGGAVKYTKTAKPGTLSFDINTWQTALPTEKLPSGKYVFTVTATDSTGRHKTLQNTAFTVLVPSTLKLTGGTAIPASFMQGTAIPVSGTAVSNYRITSVTATIATSAGAVVYTKAVNPASTSYSIASWGAAFPIAALPAGKYVFTVTGTDIYLAPENRTLQNSAFTVMPPSTLGISGEMSVPGSFPAGTGIRVTGIVSSNYTLTKVTAAIRTSGGTGVYVQSINPNTMSFNLGAWDSALAFSRLGVGSYTYTVSASDSSGKVKTLQYAAFTVTTAARPGGGAGGGGGGSGRGVTTISGPSAPYPKTPAGYNLPDVSAFAYNTLFKSWERESNFWVAVSVGRRPGSLLNTAIDLTIRASKGDVGAAIASATLAINDPQVYAVALLLYRLWAPGAHWDLKPYINRKFGYWGEDWVADRSGNAVRADVFGNVTFGYQAAQIGIAESVAVKASHASGAGNTDPADDYPISIGYMMYKSYPGGMSQSQFLAFILAHPNPDTIVRG